MIPDVLVTEPTGFDRDSESGGTGHSGVVDSCTGSGTTSTKRPSDAFIGTVIGLMIVLCVPSDRPDTPNTFQAVILTWDWHTEG